MINKKVIAAVVSTTLVVGSSFTALAAENGITDVQLSDMGQPMGMEQPMDMGQPSGMQQPMEMGQPSSMQQPMDMGQPSGTQQPMDMGQPSEMQLSQGQTQQEHPDVSQQQTQQPQTQQPHMNQPQMNPPTQNQTDMQQPQAEQPEMNQPQMNQPQVNQPQMDQPQMNQSQQEQMQQGQPPMDPPEFQEQASGNEATWTELTESQNGNEPPAPPTNPGNAEVEEPPVPHVQFGNNTGNAMNQPPEIPGNTALDQQPSQNIFSSIGGAIRNGINTIGNWFKGLFGLETNENADQESTFNQGFMPNSPANTSGITNTSAMPENMQGFTPMNMPGNSGNNFPGGPNEMGGGSAPSSYDSAYTATEDISGDGTETYYSSSDNENAILVDNNSLSISGITVSKTGDSDGENADFYGTNAGILASNGSNLTLSDVTVSTDGAHANAVFSYGTGTTVTISDSTITTTGNNSGGLMTTGGATLIADSVSISTSGNSSAAIRTDRGGGTVTATDTTGTTSGVGSPAIYSTADITVTDSVLSASNSEAVVIEGGNSVTVIDSDLTGNNATLNGQSTTPTNVLIYQSMSGDASEGNSEFTMTGGSLSALTGSLFHVTNVTTTINLTDVAISYAEDSDVFLDLSADSWGTQGSNGGNATVNLSQQEAAGDIEVDSVSSLVLNIADISSYTGAINSTNSAGSVTVSIDSVSTWTLTGDTYIDSFEGDLSSINFNGYTLYINGLGYTNS